MIFGICAYFQYKSTFSNVFFVFVHLFQYKTKNLKKHLEILHLFSSRNQQISNNIFGSVAKKSQTKHLEKHIWNCCMFLIILELLHVHFWMRCKLVFKFPKRLYWNCCICSSRNQRYQNISFGFVLYFLLLSSRNYK